jgi:hypothetical protein
MGWGHGKNQSRAPGSKNNRPPGSAALLHTLCMSLLAVLLRRAIESMARWYAFLTSW